MFEVHEVEIGYGNTIWDCGIDVRGPTQSKLCPYGYNKWSRGHDTKQEAIRCRLERLLDAWTCTNNKKVRKYQRIEEAFADPLFEKSEIAQEFNALLKEYWET